MKKNDTAIIVCVRVMLAAILWLAVAANADAAPASLEVKGMGLLGNRNARTNLKLLIDQNETETFSPGAIEDGALILHSQLQSEGYLRAQVTVHLVLDDGIRLTYPLDAQISEPLPRPLAIKSVVFEVERGRRFSLDEILFSGLTAVPEEEARRFFVGETMLIPLASERVYAPDRLRRSVENLAEHLRQQGFAEATVEVAQLKVDDDTGAAAVKVAVKEGPLWRVENLELVTTDGSEPPANFAERAGQPWSSLWRQALRADIWRWYYRRGFPDVQVTLVPEAAPPTGGSRRVAVTARIDPGPAVTLGEIRLEGNRYTRSSILRRLINIEPGEPLNPVRLDNAQARIARLGVFNHVQLRYEPADGPVRDAVYQMREGRRQDVNLLFGYGSYEQLRGGVEWRHYNLFGRAHTSDLKLVQSLKSSQAEYLYTVPELFGTTVDGSTRLFGLRRDELSFRREEAGATVSFLWPLRGLRSTLTTAYTYTHLRNENNELATNLTDSTQTDVAAMEFTLVRDRRDNPIRPQRGYKLYGKLEEASTWLGGRVDYQKYTIDASYHTAWGRSRWIHLGLTHGLITTFGAPDDKELPVNVRFYPGGDGSIRGYTRGEAAPRAENGQFVGAKSLLRFNAEVEQALTKQWSVVLFFDAVGTAVSLADYPFAEDLYSAGLGLRYNTVVGPLRVEYGRNLNPRTDDPSGTWQFSIGFPF